MQEKINEQGQKYIAGLKATAGILWIKACEFDNIPPDSKFVVFSDENKFAKFYNQALLQMEEAKNQYAAGGYVGLTIGKGKH
ncbi:MAG: hypothetical protein V1767_01140 [Chloroflexota bacterium]